MFMNHAERLSKMIAYQEERQKRWEIANQKGGYSFRTFVNSTDVEEAKRLAGELISTSDEALALRGLKRRLRQISKLWRPDPAEETAARLLQITSHELTGNVELADIEIESGLFKPYDGIELAYVIASNIQQGDIEIREVSG